jgi:hypothetical protein
MPASSFRSPYKVIDHFSSFSNIWSSSIASAALALAMPNQPRTMCIERERAHESSKPAPYLYLFAAVNRGGLTLTGYERPMKHYSGS